MQGRAFLFEQLHDETKTLICNKDLFFRKNSFFSQAKLSFSDWRARKLFCNGAQNFSKRPCLKHIKICIVFI